MAYTRSGSREGGTLSPILNNALLPKPQNHMVGLPDVRAPPFRPRKDRQTRVEAVLPVRPEILGLLLVARQLEAGPAVLRGDLLDDVRGLLQRARGRTLELEEQAVLLWPFTRGEAVDVRRAHEVVVDQLHAF